MGEVSLLTSRSRRTSRWSGTPSDVAGPVRPTGEYRFTGDGETTTVSLSLEAQMSGVKKLLMSRAVQKSTDGEMHALDRAKAILESG